jgi:GDPmannose 4,6-dehydratase
VSLAFKPPQYLALSHGDFLDQDFLIEAIQFAKPDEVYNLGAQSVVPTSWNQPVLTGNVSYINGVYKMSEVVYF